MMMKRPALTPTTRTWAEHLLEQNSIYIITGWVSCRERRKSSWVSLVLEENEAAEGQTLSLWVGSAPWASSNSTTAKWPPAQASDSTVWSLFAVVLFTFAPAQTKGQTSAGAPLSNVTEFTALQSTQGKLHPARCPTPCKAGTRKTHENQPERGKMESPSLYGNIKQATIQLWKPRGTCSSTAKDSAPKLHHGAWRPQGSVLLLLY